MSFSNPSAFLCFGLLALAFVGCISPRVPPNAPLASPRIELRDSHIPIAIDVPHVLPGHLPAITADPLDPAWAKAAVISPLTPSLVDREGATGPGELTRIAILWDRHYLYVRFECVDPDVFLPVHGRDAPLYKGDVAEVFIDPVGDGRQYVELQVNAAGDLFDQLILITAAELKSDVRRRLIPEIVDREFWPIVEWNMPELRRAGRVAVFPDSTSGWIVDLAIPAGPLLRRTGRAVFSTSEILRANFIRYEWVSDHTGRTLDASNWAPVSFGCPHISPAAMGAIRLVASAP